MSALIRIKGLRNKRQSFQGAFIFVENRGDHPIETESFKDDQETRMSNVSESNVSVVFSERFEPLIKERPVCVMARSVAENTSPKHIDAIFKRTAKKRYSSFA